MWRDVLSARDLRDERIDAKAKAVLVNLASRLGSNDECWPSVSLIAADCSMSAKGVQRAIKDLRTLGYLIVESGKVKGVPNRYHLELVNKVIEDMNSVGQPDRGGRTKKVGQGDRAGRTIGAAGSDSLTEGKKTLKEEASIKSVSEFVPTNIPKKDAAVSAAYAKGASWEEALAFWRFNQLRKWKALTVISLEELADEWVTKWIKKNPGAFEAEYSRRRQEAERREYLAREKLLREARARGEIP